MCLSLNMGSILQTAEEDIVCYKWVKIDMDVLNSMPELHGKEFHGVINDIEVDGVISRIDGRIYFCSNIARLDGKPCIYTFDYTYSWMLDHNVKSVIVDDKELLTKYVTPYRYAQVNIGETYYSNLIQQNYNVNVGLHSFKHYNDARLDAKDDGCVFHIVECIIPIGTQYYEGTFSCLPSYASKCIKYVKII